MPLKTQQLIQQQARTTPLRKANHIVTDIGTLVATTPIMCNRKSYPPQKEKFFFDWIMKKLDDGLLKTGTASDWTSPFHLVAKYDKQKKVLEGQYRVTLDATSINRAFSKLPISMATVDDILRELRRWSIKMVVDLVEAFYHLEIPEKWRQYFGVACSFGVFRYTRMPQGFINSPSIMQNVAITRTDTPINMTLKKKGIAAYVVTYIDDVIIGCNKET